MEFESVIRNGSVITGTSQMMADIGIAGGKIVAIGKDLPAAMMEIDAEGKFVFPGAIDVHTHFGLFDRNIGLNNADDYESGTRSAAAGGITTVLNFAFQTKGQGLQDGIETEIEKAKGRVHIDYGLHLVVTDLDVKGVCEQIGPLADDGFASLKIFTTLDAVRLSDRDIIRVLREAKRQGMLVNVHAEDDATVHCMTESLLGEGKRTVEYFAARRPASAEGLATSRVAAYAQLTSCPVYFVHLSSASALDAVRRARNDGAEIYVETRPLYLFLDDSKYLLPDGQGAKYVCYPPLRTIEDQRVLWDALRTGEIQTYATDHGPWNSAEKLDSLRNFDQIPAGVSNVETSVGMLFSEGVGKNRISLSRFVQLVSANPAKLFGMYPSKGTLSIGADADIVLIDPHLEVTMGARPIESRADYEPFEGYKAVGWPVLTMSRGEVIFRNGEILSRAGRGRLLKRDRYLLP